MKHINSTAVLFPYIDEQERKQWLRFRFYGDLPRKRLYREMKKAIKKLTGVDVSVQWMKINLNIIDSAAPEPETPESKARFNEFVEAFIKEVEYNEDEAEGDSELTGEDSQRAEQPL